MIYNYCPECAKPLTKHNDTYHTCPDGHEFFNNPKTATGIVLKKDGRYLFAIRGREPYKDKIDIIGGFVDYGESALAAVVREIKEESGLDIPPEKIRLVSSFTGEYLPGSSTTSLVYVCDDWQGEPVAADDVSGFSWEPLEVILSDRWAWASADLPRVLADLKREFNE